MLKIMKAIETDVLVIGAGPAGAVAAASLPLNLQAIACATASSAIKPVSAANPLAELAIPEAMGKLFWLTTRAR